jgi:hypothetical protein
MRKQRKLALTSDCVELSINEYGTKIDGIEIEKILNEQIGNSEQDKFKSFHAKVTIFIEEILPPTSEGLKVSNLTKEVEDNNGKGEIV